MSSKSKGFSPLFHVPGYTGNSGMGIQKILILFVVLLNNFFHLRSIRMVYNKFFEEKLFAY